jgi:arsenate reductase
LTATAATEQITAIRVSNQEEERVMTMAERILVYEKPTCTTCRQLAKLLRESGVEYEAIDYLLDPIPREELARLIGKMGISVRELLRTREAAYRELELGRKDLTDDELLDAMAAHPELVQRPIVVRGDRVVLARPAERVREVL